MSKFPETGFVQYINAEAPVLRKSGKRSSQLREEGNKAYMGKRNEQVRIHSLALQYYRLIVRH